MTNPEPSEAPREPTAFERAVTQAGGLAALATAIGVKTSRAGNWYSRGVPAEHCPAIERVTAVRCEDLRSDHTWTRDENGRVTGYHVRLSSAA